MGKSASIDPPFSGIGSGSMPAGRRKRTGGHRYHPPSVGSDFDGTPMVVGEIEIECPACSATRTWTERSGASNCARASSKSSSDEIACGAKSAAGGLVIAAPQPAAKALAADGPGFPVTIDQEIGKGGAAGGVKQLATPPQSR